MRDSIAALIALSVAFCVHDALPRGLFGPHDIAVRAAVAGGTAAVTLLAIRAWKSRKQVF